MSKQTIQFATVKQDNVINKIGKSALLQPEVNYEEKSKPTNWFDDSILIKKDFKKQ